MYKSSLISGMLLLGLAFSSCKDDVSVSTDINPNGGTNFNYENKSDMQLNLTFRDSYGKANAGVFVKIYTQNPYDGLAFKTDLIPSMKGIADANGNFATNVPVPGDVTHIFVVIDNLLYSHCLTLKKSQNYTSNIYPAGYGVLKNSVSKRSAVGAPIAYTRATSALPVSNKVFVLDTYNATSGKPDVLETADPASAGLVTRITTALPESFNTYGQAATNHYFDNVAQANIQVIDNANIWVTFISEGAGVNNTMGYFYYPTNTPPSDTAHISKRLIIFPNASTSANDGGGTNGRLTNGTKVKLKYQDPNTGDWSDVFPAGTTISWFLTESGWGGSAYDSWFASRQRDHFSLPSFNKAGLPQTVLLYDAATQKIVLGFEDTALSPATGTSGAGTYPSDKDFNDVVFAISANPITAVNTDPIKRISDAGDTDGDGVPDTTDDYPTDPLRAFNNFYPGGAVFGSLAFEDNWPSKGDYDFNDLVVDYRIMYVTNASGNVKDIEFQTRVPAIGASYKNGFAWQIDANQSNIASVTTSYTGPGVLLPGAVFPVSGTGYETGITPTSKVVIPFFDNAFTLFGATSIPGFVNTIPGNPYYAPVSVIKKVTFTSAVTLGSLGSMPYNPFIIVDGVRSIEVHKVNHAPTNKMAQVRFGTMDDLSIPGSGIYYVGSASYPWVLDTPTTLAYPTEDLRPSPPSNDYHVSTAFKKFDSWAQSNGSTFTDWFSNTDVSYRNTNRIFSGR